MKFFFLTLLIGYLIYKLLGFLLRFYVKAQIVKFDPQNRTQTENQNINYNKVNTSQKATNKDSKGNSGEYIDYEIVK